jgi:hypothetical protein
MAIVIYRHPDMPRVVRVMLEDKKKIKATINTILSAYFGYVDRVYYVYTNNPRVSIASVYRRICEPLNGTARLEFYRIDNMLEWLINIKQQYDIQITTDLLEVAEPDEMRKFINKLRDLSITCEREYIAHKLYGVMLPVHYTKLYPDFQWSAVVRRPFEA